MALPSSSGTFLVSHICFINWWVIAAAALPPACSASAHMLSGPGALSFASSRMIAFIVCLLGGFEAGCVLGSRFGYLSSAYVLDQKLMNLSASSCSSFAVGFSFLLCCSLIFFISFQLSVVFAIFASLPLMS